MVRVTQNHLEYTHNASKPRHHFAANNGQWPSNNTSFDLAPGIYDPRASSSIGELTKYYCIRKMVYADVD
jgi:hypothetical protein